MIYRVSLELMVDICSLLLLDALVRFAMLPTVPFWHTYLTV